MTIPGVSHRSTAGESARGEAMTGVPALPMLPFASPTSIRPNSSLLATTTRNSLTQLVAQSKNQKPLSPAEPGDTLLQLASLAQLSGLQDIKATLEQILVGQTYRERSHAGSVGARDRDAARRVARPWRRSPSNSPTPATPSTLTQHLLLVINWRNT